jgi:hypothetical protein
MVTITDIAYPHTAVIARVTVNKSAVPFTSTTSTIWSGVCDCQIGRGGATGKKQDVFVSDYTIFCEIFDAELMVGDTITVTLKSGWTPIECTIKQFSSDNIFVEDGVEYGTTIWANRVLQ